MPSENILKYGILKCRDAVAQYYGWPMVVSITETAFAASSTPYLILKQDPRRIRYEIWINNFNDIVGTPIAIGSPAAIDSGNAATISAVALTANIPIVRDFLSDLEAVCLPVMVHDPEGTNIFSVRETFLTPAPVDEVPLA